MVDDEGDADEDEPSPPARPPRLVLQVFVSMLASVAVASLLLAAQHLWRSR